MSLENCAHCGREAKVSPSFRGDWQVACTRCGDRVFENDPVKAQEKWNEAVLAKRKWLAEESACDNRFAYLKHRADVANCCKNPYNLDVARPQPDTLIARCRKCGAKHRKVRMEPGHIRLFSGAADLGVRQ